MPRFAVTEHRSYTLTFFVDAATEEEAMRLASDMSADEGDEVEEGARHVDVERLKEDEESTEEEDNQEALF